MKESELILNPDGSIYHLNLLPGDVAPWIFLVGDPERVSRVSEHFDEVVVRKSKREFITHTGRIGRMPVSVISTGIGTDNIDIVMNEVDALFNVDMDSRNVREQITPLTFVRLGTSGTIQREVPVDSIMLSRYALGLDAFTRLNVHQTDAVFTEWCEGLQAFLAEHDEVPGPIYRAVPDEALVHQFKGSTLSYITITCAGFYGLQGRSVRIKSNARRFFDLVAGFDRKGLKAGNLEMETAGIYLLAGLMGHRALSLNAIIANRATGTFSSDPYAVVDKMIKDVCALLPGV